MDTPTQNMLSLFSGIGGLDLGIHAADPSIRTVCYVEKDLYAASVLARQQEAGTLHPAPIWDDVTTFDGKPWRSCVDIICGGFPCQDISNAGKREGITGSRSGLWFEYARIIGEIRPRIVFIENVRALYHRGLDEVLRSLTTLGYDAEWDCFSAEETGAPHKRERVFVMAYRNERTLQLQSGRSSRKGRQEKTEPQHDHKNNMGDTDESRLEGRHMCGEPSPNERIARERIRSLGRFPPRPDDAEGWARLLSEMPDLKPAICRESHGLAYRMDRLRCLGNAVVPHTAALAWLTLRDRIDEHLR